MNKYIYMKKFYILTVLFALLGISNVWAAWEGSGSAVKYENGTYYVVYELMSILFFKQAVMFITYPVPVHS